MILFLCLLYGASESGSTTWIDADAFGSAHIVLSRNAGDEQRAAADLFKTTWKTCTGYEPSLGETPNSGVNIWIGTDCLPEAVKAEQGADRLGRDGVRIKTFATSGAPSLLLAGGEGKGELYAVYEFFEQAFGVRWLAPDATHIPPAPESLAPVDYAYSPPLRHRKMGVQGDAAPYRLNTPFEVGIGGHSLYYLLPPEEYFAEHPEYYSLVKGKRIAPVGIDWRDVAVRGEYPEQLGQLCMSNPATAEAIARAIERKAREKPSANLWSICQMDWKNNCECPECRAIDEREGTPMGSLLTGVNRVAELLERDHPNFFFYTYAYTYTRKPPNTLKPRPNVVIQLCDIECDFARPLTDPESPANRGFVEDFKGWSKLTDRILIYDYPVNYWRYQMPHPMFPVFGPNMAFYADQKTLGVYQLTTDPVTDGFGFLKQYVLGKLLWNPYADTNALKNEFIDLYYGPAAPYIKEFITLSERKLKEARIELWIGDRGGWMDRDYVAASEALFKQAFAACRTKEIRDRVDLAYVQVQFAALDCRPELIAAEKTLTLRRPPSLSPKNYVQRLKHFGIKYLGEHRSRGTTLEYYRGAMAARKLTCDLIRLENDAYLVWIAPALEGSILRFQDKRSGRELLRGYTTYGAFPGAWQDWVDRGTYSEEAAAKEYSVAERDDRHAVIEARLESGLLVRRTMNLRPGDAPLEVELSFTNPTRAPLAAKVKFHPEFYCQTAYKTPEIWLEKSAGWTQLNVKDMNRGPLGVGLIEANGAKRWAFFVPDAQLTLMNGFDPAQVGQLLYFYNTDNCALQVNLELLPSANTLSPGESRAMRATYQVSSKRPTEW